MINENLSPELQEEQNKTLYEMYVNNVSNRLRKLQNPNENEKKRWIWELFQNAKDSISGDEYRESVSIEIHVTENSIIFKHNGSPFQAPTLNSLIWQKSNKREIKESTGRFGTGFLTTHTLSKTINVSGVNLEKDKLHDFNVTLYRDGENDSDLEKGIKDTLASYKYQPNDNLTITSEVWTSFEYIDTHQNREIANLGLDSLKKLIFYNLTFVDKIQKVTIRENGTTTLISRAMKPYTLENSQVIIHTFNVSVNEKLEKVVKIVNLKNEYYDEQLNKKLRTEIAIELTENNEIVEIQYKTIPYLFCDFPLIGTENFYLPFVINSRDFEPDTERDKLLLNGDSKLITINKKIILKSIELYNHLMDFASSSSWENTHYLAKSANKTISENKEFDKTWFDEEVLAEIRKKILYTPIVKTKSGLSPIKILDNEENILFPSDKTLWEFAEKVYPNQLPVKELVDEWYSIIWTNYLTTETLAEKVSLYANIDSLPNSLCLDTENNIETQKINWLDDFIKYLDDSIYSNLLDKIPLIPNHSKNFSTKTLPNFSNNIDIPDELIKVLFDLGADWNEILKHKKITYNLQNSKNILTIATEITLKIREKIKLQDFDTVQKTAFSLIKYLPKQSETVSESFICKRRKIHYFAKSLFGAEIQDFIEVNNWVEFIWEEIDKWIINNMIKAISDKKELKELIIDEKESVVWLNEFIGFVKEYGSIDVLDSDSCKILPNQNGIFTKKSELNYDKNIPNELKNEIIENLGIYLKNNLLHPEISAYKPERDYDLSLVSNLINNKIEERLKISKQDPFVLNVVYYLTQCLPSVETNSPHKELHEIGKTLFPENITNTIIISGVDSLQLWQKTDNIFFNDAIKKIEHNANLSNLKTAINKSDEIDTAIWLNNFFKFSVDCGLDNKLTQVFPNENGDFVNREILFRNQNIPKELKDIVKCLNSTDDFDNILLHSAIDYKLLKLEHAKTTKDIATKINDLIFKGYRNQKHLQEDSESFKKAVHILVVDWFNNPKYPRELLDEYDSGNYQDKLNDRVSRELFKWSFEHRYELETNVLSTVEERKELYSLNSKLTKEDRKKLSENPDIVKQYEELQERVNELERQIESLKNKKTENQTNTNASHTEPVIDEAKTEEKIIIENFVNISQKYSFEWFKSFNELWYHFSTSNNSQSELRSYSFEKLEIDIKSNKLIHISETKSFIPYFIENAEKIEITFYFTDNTEYKPSVRGISVKNDKVSVLLKESFKYQPNNLKKTVLKTSSSIDLLNTLKNAFKKLHFQNSDCLKNSLPQAVEFLFGPPGTGKTTEVAKRIISEKNKNILVLTPTNKAADVLTQKIIKICEESNIYYSDWLIRFGSTLLDELQEKEVLKTAADDFLAFNSKVMITTIARFPYDSYEKYENGISNRYNLNDEIWDYVIFDESSMIALPYVIFSIYKSLQQNLNCKYIVSGDPFQIPPVVDLPDLTEIESLSELKEENIYSIVELKSFDPLLQNTKPHKFLIHNLQTQYRSVPAIGDLFSKFTYNDLINHHRTKSDFRPLNIQTNGNRLDIGKINIIEFPVNSFDSIYRPDRVQLSGYQPYSAILTTEFIISLAKKLDGNWNIGVVCLYKAQAKLINNLISANEIHEKNPNLNVVADTVHGFQGDEFDIIICVFNPSSPKIPSPTHRLGRKNFFHKKNILNVAISRAQEYLFILTPDSETDGYSNMVLFNSNNGIFDISKKLSDVKYFVHKDLEKHLFGASDYIEKNSFRTDHQLINVYTKPIIKYFISTDNNSIDVQLNN